VLYVLEATEIYGSPAIAEKPRTMLSQAWHGLSGNSAGLLYVIRS